MQPLQVVRRAEGFRTYDCEHCGGPPPWANPEVTGATSLRLCKPCGLAAELWIELSKGPLPLNASLIWIQGTTCAIIDYIQNARMHSNHYGPNGAYTGPNMIPPLVDLPPANAPVVANNQPVPERDRPIISITSSEEPTEDWWKAAIEALTGGSRERVRDTTISSSSSSEEPTAEEIEAAIAAGFKQTAMIGALRLLRKEMKSLEEQRALVERLREPERERLRLIYGKMPDPVMPDIVMNRIHEKQGHIQTAIESIRSEQEDQDRSRSPSVVICNRRYQGNHSPKRRLQPTSEPMTPGTALALTLTPGVYEQGIRKQDWAACQDQQDEDRGPRSL